MENLIVYGLISFRAQTHLSLTLTQQVPNPFAYLITIIKP